MSETDIQGAILEAFKRLGVLAWRCNSGKVRVRGGWMHLAPVGTPDILVVVPPRGRLLGLEVKTLKGREREAQTAWAVDARQRGASVATVRSVAEAVAAFAMAKEAA